MRFTSKNLSLIFPVAVAIFFLQAGVTAAQGKDYQALTLDDCLALAREQNPVLSATREKIQELVADYKAARSKFFPRLVLTVLL